MGCWRRGLESGEGDELGIPGVQAGHEGQALAAELLEELRDGPLVVAAFPGLPVGHVRGAQDLGAGQEVVEPAGVELVEIEKMPDVLLDRPGLAVASRQELGRQAPYLVLDPGRRAPEPLDHDGEERFREHEVELAVDPAGAHDASIPHPRSPERATGSAAVIVRE